MALDDLRDRIYWWSLDLVKNGFKLEGIFLLLSTWNFATFRYAMIGFRLKEFETTLKNCDFNFFKNKKFETVDLSNDKIVENIKRIYFSLSRFKGVKYVGATKVMHLLNPKFFMMWDRKIMKHYKIKDTPQSYVDFMRLMQKMWKEDKFPKPQNGETIPRAIDRYNWDKYYNKAR